MAAFVLQPLVLNDLAHGVKFEDNQARFPRASACARIASPCWYLYR